MFQLVLIYSFMAAACSVDMSVSSTFAPNTRYFYQDGAGIREFPKAPPMCAPYRAYAYTKLDTYPTYQACMARVAKVAEHKDLKAICRAV